MKTQDKYFVKLTVVEEGDNPSEATVKYEIYPTEKEAVLSIDDIPKAIVNHLNLSQHAYHLANADCNCADIDTSQPHWAISQMDLYRIAELTLKYREK